MVRAGPDFGRPKQKKKEDKFEFDKMGSREPLKGFEQGSWHCFRKISLATVFGTDIVKERIRRKKDEVIRTGIWRQWRIKEKEAKLRLVSKEMKTYWLIFSFFLFPSNPCYEPSFENLSTWKKVLLTENQMVCKEASLGGDKLSPLCE